MGGSNETTINGLRCHVNNGNVHIHDDSKNLKFESTTQHFNTEIKAALKTLNDDADDQVIKIDSTMNGLYLIKSNGITTMCLDGGSDIEDDLKKFLKDC
jgi:hypothetical protein